MKKVAYVTNTDSNDLSVVDLVEQKELGRIPIGGSPRGCMVIDAKGRNGYVSNCAGNTISVIDLHSNRELTRIPVGVAPRGVALSPVQELLFVSNSGSADLSIVDLRTQEEVGRVPVGDNPRALSVTPDGQYVCIPCWGSDAVSFVKVNHEQPDASFEAFRVPLGQDAKPYHAMADGDGVHVYTANTHRHTISVLNLLDMKVEREISVGYGPRGVLPDPDEPFLYVSCEASNTVAVIDKTTWSMVKEIPVGPTPRGMRIDQVDKVLMVVGFSRYLTPAILAEANALSVIDLRTKEKVNTIKVGLGPCSVNIYDPALYEPQREREQAEVTAQ